MIDDSDLAISGDDAYVRLPFVPSRLTLSTLHSGSLTFVDVDPGSSGREGDWDMVLSWFLTIPPSLLVRASTILVRWPPEWQSRIESRGDEVVVRSLQGLADVLAARQVTGRLGFVVFGLGQPPRIIWHGDPSIGEDDAVLLQRARSTELQSYLVWGSAIWRPTSYHYVLPSGDHARTFVRFADALRDQRAAFALATWLYAGLSSDGPTTVIVDSGTLSPIVNELRHFAEANGLGVSRVVSLDSHPVSRFEYRRIVKPAEGVQALGIISVSASGHLHERFKSVLRETVGDNFRLERLVARTELESVATGVPTELVTGSQAPWINLFDRLDTPVARDGENCGACRAPSTARLVHIHPGSMTAMSLPEPDRLIPDIFDAMRNASLWERYNASADNSLSYAGPTRTRPVDARHAGTESHVYFEPCLLLKGDDVAGFLRSRRDEILNMRRRSAEDSETSLLRRAVEALPRPADAIVIDVEELGQFELGEFQSAMAGLSESLGDSYSIYAYTASQGPHGGSLQLRSGTGGAHDRIVLMSLGLRSGVTLQRMFLAARSQWDSAQIGGLVLHAHSSDTRIWDSIRNTFRDSQGISRLFTMWLTYLPRRSPLAEERETLNALSPDELDEELIGIRNERTLAIPDQLLWGPANVHLRPTSYFGQDLSDWTTVVAVGSAMHSARLRARRGSGGGPHWAVFNLPHIFRSYFDGTIHSAVLRWLRPNEAWWGQAGEECIPLLQQLEERSGDDWKTLLPELLLAGAQGKLPVEGVNYLISRGAIAQQTLQWSDRERLWVRFGCRLSGWALDVTQ